MQQSSKYIFLQVSLSTSSPWVASSTDVRIYDSKSSAVVIPEEKTKPNLSTLSELLALLVVYMSANISTIAIDSIKHEDVV